MAMQSSEDKALCWNAKPNICFDDDNSITIIQSNRII